MPGVLELNGVHQADEPLASVCVAHGRPPVPRYIRVCMYKLAMQRAAIHWQAWRASTIKKDGMQDGMGPASFCLGLPCHLGL